MKVSDLSVKFEKTFKKVTDSSQIRRVDSHIMSRNSHLVWTKYKKFNK